MEISWGLLETHRLTVRETRYIRMACPMQEINSIHVWGSFVCNYRALQAFQVQILSQLVLLPMKIRKLYNVRSIGKAPCRKLIHYMCEVRFFCNYCALQRRFRYKYCCNLYLYRWEIRKLYNIRSIGIAPYRKLTHYMCEVRLFAITVPCNSDSGTHIVATCTHAQIRKLYNIRSTKYHQICCLLAGPCTYGR